MELDTELCKYCVYYNQRNIRNTWKLQQGIRHGEEWQSRFENYQLKNAIAKNKSQNKAILPRIQQGETKGRKYRRG